MPGARNDGERGLDRAKQTVQIEAYEYINIAQEEGAREGLCGLYAGGGRQDH